MDQAWQIVRIQVLNQFSISCKKKLPINRFMYTNIFSMFYAIDLNSMLPTTVKVALKLWKIVPFKVLHTNDFRIYENILFFEITYVCLPSYWTPPIAKKNTRSRLVWRKIKYKTQKDIWFPSESSMICCCVIRFFEFLFLSFIQIFQYTPWYWQKWIIFIHERITSLEYFSFFDINSAYFSHNFFSPYIFW